MKKLVVLLALPLALVACKKDSSDASKSVSNVAKKVSTKNKRNSGTATPATGSTTPSHLQNQRSTVVLEKDIDMPVTMENINGMWKVTHVQNRFKKYRYSELAKDEAKNYEMHFTFHPETVYIGYKMKGSTVYIPHRAYSSQLVGNKVVTQDTRGEVNADYKLITLRKRTMRIQDLSRKDRVDYYLVRVN